MAYVGPFPLSAADGGTGDSSLTLNGVLIGGGTGDITALGVGTNGQVLLGATSAAPAFATLTSTGGTITFTTGANSLNLEVTSGGGLTFDADSGSATPSASVITFHGGLNLTTSATGSTVTIAETQAPLLNNYTSVASGASPYTVLSTDYYISANVSSGAVTLKLPNAPTTNRTFIIKDKNGAAATNNITVTTVGGSVTIDGATSYTISTNYAAVNLVFNGTSYEVY